MADDCDRASDLAQQERDMQISALGSDIPRGVAGDCDLCGDWFGRLVDGECVPCRDKYEAKQKLTHG